MNLADVSMFRACCLLTAFVSPLVSLPLAAQSINPPPATAGGGAGTAQETVELSPFVVNVDADRGWTAEHSMLGNRTNQPIKDIAASIEALTTDFLEEVGAYDAFAAIEFATNALVEPEWGMAQSLGTGGGSNLENNRYSYRGISNEGQPSRNLWTNAGMPSDTYNVERIEVGRGSNSLLFGEVEAGGQANITTKRAHIGRNSAQVQAQAGSFDTYRLSLDYNRTLTKKLAARLNLTKSTAGRDFDWNEFETDAVHGSLTYAPFKNTIIRAEAEWGLYARNWGTNQMMIDSRVAPGLAYNRKWLVLPDNTVVLNTTVPNADRNRPTGPRVTLLDTDAGGLPRHYNWAPNQFNDKEMNTVSLYWEQRVKDFAFELAFNQQFRHHLHSTAKSTNLISVDGRGRRYIDYTYQGQDSNIRDKNLRATLVYKWEPFDWMQQFLVASAQANRSQETIGRNGGRDVNYLDRSADGFVNVNNAQLWYRVYIDDPGAYSRSSLDRRLNLAETSVFQVYKNYISGGPSNYWENESYTLSANGSYLGGRLLSLIGARVDFQEAFQSNTWTNNPATRLPDGQSVSAGKYADHPERYDKRVQLNSPENGNWSRNYSLTYKINDNINVYGVYSESFRQADGNAINLVNEPIGQKRGETKELGIKSDFFQRRLQLNLSAFDIMRLNETVNHQLTILTLDELEELFNVNGTYPGDPEYLEVISRRDKQDFYSKGVDGNVTFQAVRGLKVRIGAGTQKVSRDPDTAHPRFKQLLDAAIARGNEDPGLVARAQQVMDAEGARGAKVTGRGAARFTFNYAVNYGFSQGRFKGLSVGVNGNYNSDYVLNYLGNVEYRGGKMLTMHGTVGYQTRIMNRPVTFRLNVKDLIENDYITRNVISIDGNVRNLTYYGIPRSYLFTTTLQL